MTNPLKFHDLVEATDAFSADPDLFDNEVPFTVGPEGHRNVVGNRWRIRGSMNLDGTIEAVVAPDRGGLCYTVSSILNDEQLRTAIIRTAGLHDRMTARFPA